MDSISTGVAKSAAPTVQAEPLRAMTLGDKFRALAAKADALSDGGIMHTLHLRDIRGTLEFMLRDINREIDKDFPFTAVDAVLGKPSTEPSL